MSAGKTLVRLTLAGVVALVLGAASAGAAVEDVVAVTPRAKTCTDTGCVLDRCVDFTNYYCFEQSGWCGGGSC